MTKEEKAGAINFHNLHNTEMKNKIFTHLFIVFFIASYSCNNPTNSAHEENSSDLLQTDSTASWAMTGFKKVDSINPILSAGLGTFVDPVTNKNVYWEQRDVYNPAIIGRNDTVYMLYRAQDSAGTSRIGLAYSKDGLHFTRSGSPVLFPSNDAFKQYEWPGGCEDPRVVQDSAGTYFMTYTAYDGKVARLFVASSKNLVNWIKHGSVFTKAYNGRYRDEWSKSGSIVSKYDNGKIVAACINGKYWMYWGDQFIWAATSDDLVNWTPVEKEKNGKYKDVLLRGVAVNMPNLQVVIPTRNKKFDSDLVEPGPPAMLKDSGILLIYNSRNVLSLGDSSLPEGTYAAGEVLLDKNDPTQIIHRLDHYIMKPDKPYELTGQVNNVCFLEGLANFKNKWFLYYGTADSKIAVAVKDEKK